MDVNGSVRAVIDKALRLAEGQPIKRIHIALGELSGVSPAQARSEFERHRHDTLAAEAELEIRIEEARAACLACERTNRVRADGEACPACGSTRTHLVAGHHVALEEVRLAREATDARWGKPARARAVRAADKRPRRGRPASAVEER